MFFSYKGIPLFTVLAILCILDVSVDVLFVFLAPVWTKMNETIVWTMVIHHVNVESMLCYKMLALVTTSTFSVPRFNWAERADIIGQKNIFLESRFTVMSSMF